MDMYYVYRIHNSYKNKIPFKNLNIQIIYLPIDKTWYVSC